MKKKLKIGILCVVLGIFGYLGYKVVSKIGYKKEVKERLQTMPSFAFKDVATGTVYTEKNIPKNKPTMFVYFNSDCDFCQHEAQMIQEHITELQNVTILFVSRNPETTIQEFAEKYHLANYPNVHFLRDEKDTFYLKFDANSIPYMLVYSKNKELILRNKGQLNIKTILKKIKAANE